MDEVNEGTVTHWIARLKQGDDDSARELWQRYFEQVVSIARRRLGSGPRRAADEEDVALSVFNSLCRGAAAGRFSQLSDRHDLWMLLLAITRQKSVDEIRSRTRQKRGGGEVRGESIFATAADQSGVLGLDAAAVESPTPELLAAADEEFQRLLGLLRDDTLRRIALMRMEGFPNDEIAEELGVSTRSIERKLRLIRDTWELQLPPSADRSGGR